MRTKLIRILLVVIAACTLTVGVIGTTPAGAKKKSCKVKKEQKGCKLKRGANYAGRLKGGSVSLVSLGKSFSVVAKSDDRRTIKDGTVCGLVGGEVSKQLKVGRSYKFKTNGGSPSALFKFDGKVKIKSAKKATISGKITATAKDKTTVLCTYQFSGKTMKRQAQANL